MKHLATIQTEFLKEARDWDKLSLEEQKAYLKRHPKSKRKITAKPKKSVEIPKSGLAINPENESKKLDKFDISQLTSISGKKGKDREKVFDENIDKISRIAKNIAGEIFSYYRERFKDGDEPDEVIDDLYDSDNVNGLINDLDIDETQKNKQWVKDNFDWIVHAIKSKLWEKFDKKYRR